MYNLPTIGPADIDPTAHPHAYRYAAQHGKLPGWADAWGNTRALTNGTGWAARLWAAADVHAVTLRLPGTVGHDLDHLPDVALPDVLRQIAHRPGIAPTLGACRPEWGPGIGWHYHGIISAQDADRLRDLPAHLGNVQIGPELTTAHAYRRALAYMTKNVRRDRPAEHLIAHADRLLRLRAAHGGRLPRLTTLYGL